MTFSNYSAVLSVLQTKIMSMGNADIIMIAAHFINKFYFITFFFLFKDNKDYTIKVRKNVFFQMQFL